MKAATMRKMPSRAFVTNAAIVLLSLAAALAFVGYLYIGALSRPSPNAPYPPPDIDLIEKHKAK